MGEIPLRRCILLEPGQWSYCHEVVAAGGQALAILPLPQELAAGEDARILCKTMLADARRVCGDDAWLCVAIYAGGLYYEPYGETPFAAGVAHFHELAASCAALGADCVMVDRAQSMLQARAGVLGARAAGLPVLVSMEPMGEGDSLLGGTDLLSAYAVLRLLGIVAFGYASSATALQLPAFHEVCPHRSIPLFSITHNLTGSASSPEAAALFAERSRRLSALGISGIGIWGAGKTQLAAAAQAMIAAQLLHDGDERGTLEQDDLWAANETQVYYLDENVEYSEPVECRLDMTDDVLEAEKEVCALFCIELTTPDDAHIISLNNGNLDQMPVSLFSEDEGALEAGLFYYNGRAVIDSRSHLDDEVIRRLARQYGALLL